MVEVMHHIKVVTTIEVETNKGSYKETVDLDDCDSLDEFCEKVKEVYDSFTEDF